MQRTCPRDRTPLVAQKVDRVTIDVCPTCSGAFFDAKELGIATGDKELARYLSRAHGAASSPMVCPACGQLMDLDKVNGVETAASGASEDQAVSPGYVETAASGASEDQDVSRGYVEIDHCTACLGVWLDAGEKERLLARAPGSLAVGFDSKSRAAEDRRYASMPRGGGGGRFAALGHAVKMAAWKLRRKR